MRAREKKTRYCIISADSGNHSEPFYENSRETRGLKHKGIFHALFRLCRSEKEKGKKKKKKEKKKTP
jgi:hypothetical protein